MTHGFQIPPLTPTPATAKVIVDQLDLTLAQVFYDVPPPNRRFLIEKVLICARTAQTISAAATLAIAEVTEANVLVAELGSVSLDEAGPGAVSGGFTELNDLATAKVIGYGNKIRFTVTAATATAYVVDVIIQGQIL